MAIPLAPWPPSRSRHHTQRRRRGDEFGVEVFSDDEAEVGVLIVQDGLVVGGVEEAE